MTKPLHGKPLIHEYRVIDARTGKTLYRLTTSSKMRLREAIVNPRRVPE